MKNTVIYIIGILLIVAFGLLFDYVENGTNYAKVFGFKDQPRVPASQQQLANPQSPNSTPASK